MPDLSRLGLTVTAESSLGSSHDWNLHRAVLSDGHSVFVKASNGSGPLAAEAASLRWLRSGDAPVPEVVAADDRTLVLPWLSAASPGPETAARLGRELAALHLTGAESYGAGWPGFIATLPLDNTAGTSWPEWYAQRRLSPYLRLAADQGSLSPSDVRLVDRVIDRIGELAGPEEPPSRIHGDLWSGNLLWTGKRAWLIDPAAHGGHRETDLAMLQLFGAPQLGRILAAYEETAPLAGGWQARVPLHQLHPLLVHVALFGSGYRTRTIDAAHAALRAAGAGRSRL